MWNPFKKSTPVCPIDPDQQQWLDARFDWLLEQFGHDAPANTRVILPTPEFFPDVYEGHPDDAQAMLNRICGYMNVDPGRLRLFLFESGHAPTPGAGLVQTSSAAGLYVPGKHPASPGDARPPAQLGIEASQLADPMALVATFAPASPGEKVTLEKRVKGGWKVVATAAEDAWGSAAFTPASSVKSPASTAPVRPASSIAFR